jgi:predicted dehydrogenase
MKQILQNLSSGETLLAEVPAPVVQSGCLLIATRASLVSAGTERMLLEFGRASWLGKARQQPEKVRQVLHKIKSEGLFNTLSAVQRKLDEPIALGYSNAGVVLAVGTGVDGFSVGDRVLCNGPHAEVVCVAKNLCAKIPDGVTDPEAAFGVVAAVSLQGIRLLQPTLGERVVIIGLGLLGLLAVQMLRANGCQVLGIDPDPERCNLARSLGAETHVLENGDAAVAAAGAFARGLGVDGVLITASTASDEPVQLAARMCRQRGRIVLVGVTGLKLNRADFYAKELSFQVSCSYGPGRYDRDYEEGGVAYPFGLVRWTEQRNFEAVLEMLANGTLEVKSLTSHTFSLEQATAAYDALSAENPLGLVLTYPNANGETGQHSRRSWINVASGQAKASAKQPCLAIIGAGNYVRQVLLPAIAKQKVRMKRIVSESGVSGSHLAKRYGIEQSGTEVEAVFSDPEIDAVVIATRHDSHAALVQQALQAGKHVYVEKPLCIRKDELEKLAAFFDKEPGMGDESGLRPRGAYSPEGGQRAESRGQRGDCDSSAIRKAQTRRQSGVATTPPLNHSTTQPLLMLGFNRRFSPHSVKLKQLLADRTAPLAIQYTVNAGTLPADHWLHDRKIGGGRIIGEACHFVDWCRFISGAAIVSMDCRYLKAADKPERDSAVITMQMEDGSVASIHYLSNGHSKLPKERVEIFCGGAVFQLDDFKRLRAVGVSGFKQLKTSRIDKGHQAAIEAFLQALQSGGESPIAAAEIFEVSEQLLAL